MAGSHTNKRIIVSNKMISTAFHDEWRLSFVSYTRKYFPSRNTDFTSVSGIGNILRLYLYIVLLCASHVKTFLVSTCALISICSVTQIIKNIISNCTSQSNSK